MALPQAQTENKQFNPEDYPEDYHICSNINGKVTYGRIIKNQPFYIIGENGKETEVGRYDRCTNCNKITKLKFNNILNKKYIVNVHKCFNEDDCLTFLYKDEVVNGCLNKELKPKPDEDFKTYKSRFREVLKRLGYSYTKNNEKPLKY